MMPGMNPKKMKQMMKQLGMKMEQLEDVESITIKTAGGEYIFDAAEVVVTTMQGIKTYQITGDARFVPAEIEIPQEDVMLVAEQAQVTVAEAEAALKEAEGDIAAAILNLTGQ